MMGRLAGGVAAVACLVCVPVACGAGEADGASAVGSTTGSSADPGPITGETGEAVGVADERADARERDLDIVEAQLERVRDSSTMTDTFTMTITTAAPARNDSIYSAWVSNDRVRVQVAAKWAAGERTFFVFDFAGSEQVQATGSFDGNRVSVTFPASTFALDRKGALDVAFTAEGTNERPPHADRAPEGRETLRLPALR